MHLPYCGTPPAPGELLARFNFDPVLIVALLVIAAVHVYFAREARAKRLAIAGWLIAAAALISPLCALSVALFAARIGQHMVLLLFAAPLIALALPACGSRAQESRTMWLATGLFFIALWLWHMPVPYGATFASTPVYWLMHISLFGSGVLLWHRLVHHRPEHTVEALIAGSVTSMQMGLLGAVLCFARHPLFFPHLLTTQAWGFAPLQDQELGGVLMWVPGIVLFLWTALRSMRHLWLALERSHPV